MNGSEHCAALWLAKAPIDRVLAAGRLVYMDRCVFCHQASLPSGKWEHLLIFDQFELPAMVPKKNITITMSKAAKMLKTAISSVHARHWSGSPNPIILLHTHVQ